jgi:hypothetical protein
MIFSKAERFFLAVSFTIILPAAFIFGYLVGRNDQNLAPPKQVTEIFYPSYSPLMESDGWQIVHVADFEATKKQPGMWDMMETDGGEIHAIGEGLIIRKVKLQWRKAK